CGRRSPSATTGGRSRPRSRTSARWARPPASPRRRRRECVPRACVRDRTRSLVATRRVMVAQRIMATAQTWDPERYARNARFVSDLGAPVVELLGPRPGERILDLGCGDGVLTQQL